MQVVLSLGGNSGSVVSNFRSLLVALYAESIIKRGFPLEAAPLYRSAPREVQDTQAYYYNTIIVFHTEIAPLHIYQFLASIEIKCGRKRLIVSQKETRPLDADIIFYGNQNIMQEGLIIPHQAYIGRRFVLQPLWDMEYRGFPGRSYLYSSLQLVLKQEVYYLASSEAWSGALRT